MIDEKLNQAFDSMVIPEYSKQKYQQTISQAQQIYDSSQENHEPDRPMVINQSWKTFWRSMMEKINIHGAMVTASLVALVVGYGVFQTTSLKTVQIPQAAEEKEFKTAIQVMKPESINLDNALQDSKRKQQESYDQASDLATQSLNKEVQKWIVGAEEAETYVSRVVPTGEVNPYLPKPESRNKFIEFDSHLVKQTITEPVSTFSIDTDTASYSFVRRQLQFGRIPGPDSVRVEELINYFDYSYPVNPDAQIPFTTTTRVLPSPWNSNNKLIHIGIKAFEKQAAEKPESNLVFLIDTSGSMHSEDKLPLLINSLRLLVNSLSDEDSIAIVTYAGQAGTVLEPTQIKDKHKIIAALAKLTAGGSTAGQAGIKEAYSLAQQHFDEHAVNRIILATDGDFNVGISDPEELKDYIAKKRESGVFLSVLGFGDGNYNDHLMQTLAQNGNGQAFYIDGLNEAQKVLVEEASSTLFPVAKDVKIQVEFNPAKVAEYRLIGYETRQLNTEDFNNDKVDAGEIGAGHIVTAIYEITPTDATEKLIDESRYLTNQSTARLSQGFNNEYGFVKIRYKKPDSTKSQKVSSAITIDQEFKDLNKVDMDVRFAVAVAGFGQLLTHSVYIADMTFDDVLELAQSARGDDPYGYRSEFIQLVKLADSLSSQ